MKLFSLILLLFFIYSCAPTTVYTPYAQKKAPFNPMMDTDCVIDTTVAGGGTFGMDGYACANDNGVQYIRPTLQKFKMSKAQMSKRAQTYCEMEGKKAVYKGKANIAFASKLDWVGEEYLCMNK